MKAEQRVQGRYTLIEPLGRGGMAEVWLAHDERLERNVAVKFMAANLCDDAEFLVRFFSEAQAVARISHPNVVAVLDFGDFEERPYLVMECAPGGTLSDLTGEPMLPERAAEIVADAARGAGAAHAVGLVHRDVKPGNILLDDEGRAKLADFGIASSNRFEKLTATGTAIGSPHYISPEQASGRAVTAASDVYSLGAVLYELLTGRPPFDGDNVTAIAIAHVEQAPVPPSAFVTGLPAHLDDIVLACLAKDPGARPRDGAALAAALETGRYSNTTSWVPAVAAADAVEGEPEEDDYEPVPKRRLVPALLALALLIALGSVVYVSGRPKDVAEAGTNGRRSTAEPSRRPDRRATPTPTPAPEGAGAEVVTPAEAPAGAPTPAPEPEEQEQESERATPTPEPEDYEGSFWTPEPSEEPTSPPSEDPEPSAPPSEEPTPAP